MLPLLVALAGAIGTLLRFWIHSLFGAGAFPLATLTVNLGGSLGIGLLFGVDAARGVDPTLRTIVAAGFLGGLTTFSGFALDLFRLLRAGAWIEPFGWFAAQNLGCLAAVALGHWLGRLTG
jgi:CrcB protein